MSSTFSSARQQAWRYTPLPFNDLLKLSQASFEPTEIQAFTPVHQPLAPKKASYFSGVSSQSIRASSEAPVPSSEVWRCENPSSDFLFRSLDSDTVNAFSSSDASVAHALSHLDYQINSWNQLLF